MTCYRDGGCGPYEMSSCYECPASKPDYRLRVAPSEVHTYPQMNETIKDLLSRSEEPMNLYILTRIKELEAENDALKKQLRPEPEDPPEDSAEQERIFRDALGFIGRFTATADGTGYRKEVIEAFTQGGCYWFAFILYHRFALEDYDVEIMLDPIANHFGCRIGGRMVFDITGEVTDGFKWEPWEEFADTSRKERIISGCIMF